MLLVNFQKKIKKIKEIHKFDTLIAFFATYEFTITKT